MAGPRQRRPAATAGRHRRRGHGPAEPERAAPHRGVFKQGAGPRRGRQPRDGDRGIPRRRQRGERRRRRRGEGYQMNSTEFIEGVKFCPKCSGLLVFRQYSDEYEDSDVDPKTGEIADEPFDTGNIGESGWLIYCKGKGSGSGCGWEISDTDEYNEDVMYCENSMCVRPLEQGRIGYCDGCLKDGHGDNADELEDEEEEAPTAAGA